MRTIIQLADELGITRQAVWLRVRLGKIRAVKVGRDWVIEDKEFERVKARGIDKS